MAGRGRGYPMNKGPGGGPPGPPTGPGLVFPGSNPYTSNNMSPVMGPPHGLLNSPVLIEQKLATQHAEIQRLLTENQRFAATHVALRQELADAQQEIQNLQDALTGSERQKQQQINALIEKSAQLETDLHSTDSLKVEFEKLNSQREELLAQVEQLTQKLQRATIDSQQITTLRTEVNDLRYELQLARMALEQEKKFRSEHFDQKQVLEKNMVSLAREVAKLRSELANAEKKLQEAASGTHSVVYNMMPQNAYGNGFVGHQESTSVGRQIVNSADNKPGTEAVKYHGALDNDHAVPQNLHDQLVKPNTEAKLAGEWSTHFAPNGKVFYHNLLTGVTQWDKPVAIIAAEAQSLSQGQAGQLQLQTQQPGQHLLPHVALLQQQQSSLIPFQQGGQVQAQQVTIGEQHALAQMQALQSVHGPVDNAVMLQTQSLLQAQSSHSTQANTMQQPFLEQVQPTWLAQAANGAHSTHAMQPSSYLQMQQMGQSPYAMHPSPHSQVQQQMG